MLKEKTKSKDYIKGFRHGVRWALAMAKCEVSKFDGRIAQGELILGIPRHTALEISLDNILIDSKKAVKSLKEGR